MSSLDVNIFANRDDVFSRFWVVKREFASLFAKKVGELANAPGPPLTAATAPEKPAADNSQENHNDHRLIGNRIWPELSSKLTTSEILKRTLSETMSDYAVELQGLTKRFGNQTAVDRLDLQIPRGSIYGVIGPNGSGKTTTIRTILRIYRPDEGRVWVLGNEDGDAADDRVGYLPEERGLYVRMTVRNVLRYFAQLKGMRRPEKQIDMWLERLGATEWAGKRIEQLSKGMAQKIQFIAAVAAKPELVILDEPFSGLDPVNMEVLRDAVLELRRSGTTVLFSTHDMDVAEQMCDRIFMIFKGKKVLDGPLHEIQTKYGEPTIRIALAEQKTLPDRLPGEVGRIQQGRFWDVRLSSESERPQLLQALSAHGDVEHFESVRPSLHDIFVRIAAPELANRSELNGNGARTSELTA